MLKELEKYEKELIAEEQKRTKPEYIELCASKISHVISNQLLIDFESLRKALADNKKSKLTEMANSFHVRSEEYMKPWWDEDLQMEREGWEWESMFYERLSIIAKKGAAV